MIMQCKRKVREICSKHKLSSPFVHFYDPLSSFTVSMLYAIYSCHENSQSEQSETDIINKYCN